MFDEIVFYTAFVLILLFSILTLWCKNIFYSLLSAICVFFLSSIFFFLLKSEYNAIIQLAVYGFAVPVILGVGIMFTNLKNNTVSQQKTSNSKYIVFLTSGLFILALIYLILTSNVVVPDDFIINSAGQISTCTKNNLFIFAENIFVRYVWAFEIISIILTIIVVGMSLINKNSEGGNSVK